jgi:rRNA maturation RNase YbeY
MSIRFATQSGDFEVPETQKVQKWIAEVVKRRDRQVGNINYLFCDDAYLLQVNRQYLDHDTYTDIITFDYCEGQVLSGDLFISVDTVRANADFYKTDFSEELNRVLIHGVLHLAGYDDQTDEQKAQMRSKEDYYLKIRKLAV